MLRTFVLIAASASIIVVAFAAYTYQDQDSYLAPIQEMKDLATSRPTVDTEGKGLKFRNVPIRPGTKPFIIVYEADGEPKYQFRSDKWEPIREDTFELIHPEVCVFMPGGQVTRIMADKGTIFVERSRGNNLNPRRGHLTGHVVILIDRTDKRWRKANPELADPAQHPDHIIKIWMDEISFDLDRSYIKSDGTLRVQSTEVEIEGKGLTLAWNERDNRIEELAIEEGKSMELRRGGSLVSFGMPGEEKEGKGSTTKPAAPTPEQTAEAARTLRQAAAMTSVGVAMAEKKTDRAPSTFIRRAVSAGATANRALSIEQVFPKKEADQKGAGRRTGEFSDTPAKPRKKIRLFDRDEDSPYKRKKKQIDTYLAIFENDVVVEQIRGMKMLGRLSGVDRLELVFDVGENARQAARGNQGNEGDQKTEDRRHEKDEAGHEKDKAAGPTASQPSQAQAMARVATTTSAPTTQPEDRTRLRLLWTGRLVMRPVESEGEQTGKRFDARAVGKEVRIIDKEQGEVVCQQLIFSNETEQAWLYGTSDHPVRLWSGESRRLQGNTIYLDRKTGLAVFDGPGLMTDTRKALAEIAVPGGEADGAKADDKDERIELSWSQGAQLEFGVADVTRVDPATGREVTKRREHVKQASFRGNVSMRQGDQAIKAEEVIMTLGPPTSAKAFVGPMEAVRASGGVSLQQQDNLIKAEKLSVSMTVDEHGRNVPKSATAYGDVLAKQGERYIRAKDLLSVVIGEAAPPPGSQPASRPGGLLDVDPAQIEKIRTLAVASGIPAAQIDELMKRKDLTIAMVRAFVASKNINPTVVEKLLKPRKPKSRLSIVEMHAFGDVVAIDPEQKLDTQAEELHCSVPDGKRIERATVIAKPGEQASVELADYVIHGHRIKIDVPRRFAEVPDKGWVRFASKQGLDGRKLDKEVPITVQWSKEMKLEGQRNVGRFVGDVVAKSQASHLECDLLQIHFEDLPPAVTELAKKKAPESRWQMIEKMIFKRSKSGSQEQSPGGIFKDSFDKKPVNVLAQGNVVVVSSIYDKEAETRLLSRMRLAGPNLTVDLKTEQLDITGPGSLLIEDYRLPTPKQGATPRPPISRPKDPLMGDLAGRGPSQTAFTWANSMTYFLQNNLAVLDREVRMVHNAGAAMVMGEDLAKAMNVDMTKLRMKGREAELTCENLTVEFLRGNRKTKGGSPFDMAGSSELNRLIATGNIYMRDSGRSLVGEELTYFRERNEITISGTPENDARLFVESSESQRGQRIRAPRITWNRNTGDIDAPGARIDSVSH
ncbi:MAG: LPS export ABC transporter periplasmic protein LptC [Phycisphaerae bacterium]|nr:LPS export ABC transporter periplasmic protein LptC [Phycisphaerae bacterium]